MKFLSRLLAGFRSASSETPASPTEPRRRERLATTSYPPRTPTTLRPSADPIASRPHDDGSNLVTNVALFAILTSGNNDPKHEPADSAPSPQELNPDKGVGYQDSGSNHSSSDTGSSSSYSDTSSSSSYDSGGSSGGGFDGGGAYAPEFR